MTHTPDEKKLKKVETISDLRNIPVIDILFWDDRQIEEEYFELMEDPNNI